MSTTLAVPAELTIALITGRPELLTALRARIEAGDTLSREELLSILTLADSVVRETQEVRERVEWTRRRLASIAANLRGASNMVDRLGEDFDRRGE